MVSKHIFQRPARGSRIGFVGAGAAATALAMGAAAAGRPIVGIVSRRASSSLALAAKVGKRARAFRAPAELAAEADLIIVGVPDRAIAEVARALAPGARRGLVVAHLSGALGSEALGRLRSAGAAVASFHPLQTFPDREGGARRLAGAFVAIEGDRAAVSQLSALARAMRMVPFELPRANRALYHASAVLTSNATLALFDLAVALFSRATGLAPARASAALLPLFNATAENLRSLGLPRALSGPVARGDVATIERHLRALARGAEDVRAAYHILGARSVAIALRKGTLSAADARRLLALFGSGGRAARARRTPTKRRNRAHRRLDP
jgi:predicted short-subunit dehydrogenase-like oxidoreductase (DUF2520 family)